ncbi:hypothetical protein LguiA_016954 [Lonicera macranthoides]
MATSSILNFFSLFTPSKQPPPPPKAAPPNNLPISSSSDDDNKRRDGYAIPPLVASYNRNNDVMSVVCPSLAYTNTMYCKSGYNVEVEVEEDESDDYLLSRFRRDVMRAGVIQEVKRRRYFENKQEERKRRVRDAARRNRARRPFIRPPEVNVEDFDDDNDDNVDFEDDDDNWDLPGDLELPYGL